MANPARDKSVDSTGSGAARSADRLAVDLLGPFALRLQDGRALRLPKKAQGLLAFLVLQQGRSVPREQLATLLWGNSATEQARQSLRQCLATLRAALGPELSAAVSADTTTVLLSPSDRWTTDIAAFETACRSASSADLERAAALYRDEFLIGLQIPVEPFTDWLTVQRQRLALLHFDALHRLALAHAQAGGLENAITVANRMAAIDPMREDAHRLLMRLLAWSGNRGGAVRQYERCHEILRSELGIAPDAETEQLAQALRSGAEIAREPAERCAPKPTDEPATSVGPSALALSPPIPDKPSIVVLPFANLSGDPGQNHFVDGLVDDITVALGRERWLFVIATPSAFALRNWSVDPLEAAAKLGVRYVLRGSVRRDGSRVRIVVQLTDAAHGGHIWSDRLEDEADNVFAMNDRLMTQVAAMIGPALRSIEIQRAHCKPTESLTAYDLYLRALPLYRSREVDNREALALLARAIEIDGNFAAAHALAARCYQFRKMLGWARPLDPSLQQGVRHAQHAAETGANDSEALWMAGLAVVQLAARMDQGLGMIERSLLLNPNSANAWTASCLVRSYLGDSERAIDDFDRAQRLNPLDLSHHLHWNAVGLAYFSAGRYSEANDAADKTLSVGQAYPPGLRLKLVTCGILGRIDDAREYVARLRAVHPECGIAWMQEFWGPLLRPHVLVRYIEGARLAGLPERPHMPA